MSKAPSMPMYWDAYISDTTHLTTEEHGAYLLLLAAMWRRNGSVPDDDKDNARILGLTVGKWRKIKARLSEFLIFNDGCITQKKLQKTWENTQEKIEKNRINGAKGGRPKGNKNNDMTKANGFNSLNPNESIPEPEPEPVKKDTNVSQKDGLFDEVDIPKPKAPKKSRMVEGWTPSQKNIEDAYSQNLTDDDIQEIANDFQIYWADRTDKSASKSQRGWDQAWRNRCRDIAPKIIRNRRMAGNQSANGYGQGGGLAGAYARRHLGG